MFRRVQLLPGIGRGLRLLEEYEVAWEAQCLRISIVGTRLPT